MIEVPKDFTFGAATAAYQIEGRSFGGCGQSHWDTFAADGGTVDRQDGAIACDHIHNWQQDLNLISDAGFDSYRFSFSWPRLFPENKANAAGFDFYDRLIDGMLERDLSPSATLYHWDLPIRYAQKGGWENRDTALYFADYAANVVDRFGDRLDHIATINEPWCVAWLSHYLGHHAPGKTSLPAAGLAMHNILLAHGKAMSAMRAHGQSNLGIVLNMEYSQPASSSAQDQRAAQIYDGIYNRWFVQSVTQGSYPDDVMVHLETHLPTGWQDDMAEISQPIDWLGLNYYTRTIQQDDGTDTFPFGKPVEGPLPKTSMGWEVYPEGLRSFLNRLADDYTGELPLFVTENGRAGHDNLIDGQVEDGDRIAYYKAHIEQALLARQDGVPVQGYYAWSALDNFEWAFGYKERFGLVHVDFETQVRTPKASWYWFQKMLLDRMIED